MPMVDIDWLKDHVEVPEGLTYEQLAKDLVKVGLEEEEIHTSQLVGPIVVGYVVDATPEPQKNGKIINWCHVDVGDEYNETDENGNKVPRGIICGAPNMKAGEKVVVTLPGAVLPGDFKIEPRKTYGHISNGMCASERELGLGDSHDGIILLRKYGFTPEEYEKRWPGTLNEIKAQVKDEHEEVKELGGLYVLGTERHESRRIDNQLRGRSGRQGDPGETQFYLSLEDDLMRLFGGDKMDRVSKMMVTADMGDDMPIQHKIISKAVESAQHKVESINFSMRKSVLEYDDVMNKQRQVIYAERNKILDGKDLTDHITEVMHDTVYRCVQEFCTKDSHDGERDLEGLRKWVVELTGHIDTPKFPDEDYEALAADVLAYVEKCYNMKAERLGEDLMRELNTQVMLRVIDTRWMNYLQEMDYLKTGIGLRGFGQRDPLVEYKTEAYGAFQILVDTMYEDYLRTVLRIEIKAAPRAVEHKEEPALEGARFSGPAEVDGDNGDSVLRKQAQVQARTAVRLPLTTVAR